ncbi:hypothetical protein RRF57_012821 [Xylaria bambusicola]|uniref:SMODS and SLOG-associating 2TM effector domain-containing protein n=1 Tax=Xylaria bambusicola TaxID=326684 RepID=A0AAN7V4L5_9PEZI
MEATPNAYSPLLTTGSKLPEGSRNSQSPEAATGTITLKTLQTGSSSMNQPRPRKAETFQSWGAPAGLPIPSNNNENLLIFRKALGINLQRDVADSNGTLEEGRKTAIGIYRIVIETQTRMLIQHALLTAFLYLVYFAQIIIGAALTALGPSAARFETTITILGAFNTVLAGGSRTHQGLRSATKARQGPHRISQASGLDRGDGGVTCCGCHRA